MCVCVFILEDGLWVTVFLFSLRCCPRPSMETNNATLLFAASVCSESSQKPRTMPTETKTMVALHCIDKALSQKALMETIIATRLHWRILPRNIFDALKWRPLLSFARVVPCFPSGASSQPVAMQFESCIICFHRGLPFLQKL